MSQESTESVEETPAPPLLRVVKGDPSPEELAALVSVVAALGAAGDAPPRRTSEWAAPHRKVRRPMLPGFVFPGPGAWRASGLPR